MTIPNEPINPVKNITDWHALGLTKREYFAAMAMRTVRMEEISFGTVGTPATFPFQWHAQKCVEFADALIKELSKNG